MTLSPVDDLSSSAPARWLDRATASHGRAAFLLVLAALILFLPGFFGLAPMDRDEPRFAQASKQMLETGDYVDIRFQTEARHKKPVGIYWLQVGAVKAAGALGVADAQAKIWVYRLPSLAGAVASVLLTWWAALAFVTRRGAFLAALMFAATILIGVEARLAKTDAVITATVVAAMGAMARVVLDAARAGWRDAAVFWTAIALGILVKGPITPMIPLFAGVALALRDRGAPWLARLRPGWGLLWCALVAAPWLVAILLKTKGQFLQDSVGQDMLGKVASGKEAHGAWPGTYFAVFWVTAWPLAPFAALAAPFMARMRRDPAVFFLLAWIIPGWILFELVPTKLPHYVLPLYPALAIGVTLALERGALSRDGLWRKLALALGPLLALAVTVVAYVLCARAGAGAATLAGVTLPGAAAVAASVASWVSAGRGRWEAATLGAVASAALACGLAWIFVMAGPGFAPYRLSPRLAEAARAAAGPGCVADIATISYREPSLVFLTRTDLYMTNAVGAATFLRAAPCRVALVEKASEARFLAEFAGDHSPRLASRVVGTNLNGGKTLDIGVYVRQGRP